VLGDKAIVLGDKAVVLGDKAVVLGYKAVVLGDKAVVLGDMVGSVRGQMTFMEFSAVQSWHRQAWSLSWSPQ